LIPTCKEGVVAGRGGPGLEKGAHQQNHSIQGYGAWLTIQW